MYSIFCPSTLFLAFLYCGFRISHSPEVIFCWPCLLSDCSTLVSSYSPSLSFTLALFSYLSHRVTSPLLSLSSSRVSTNSCDLQSLTPCYYHITIWIISFVQSSHTSLTLPALFLIFQVIRFNGSLKRETWYFYDGSKHMHGDILPGSQIPGKFFTYYTIAPIMLSKLPLLMLFRIAKINYNLTNTW